VSGDNRVKMAEEPTNRLQNISIAAYIVVADQEAFQTGRFRLLFLDDQREPLMGSQLKLPSLFCIGAPSSDHEVYSFSGGNFGLMGVWSRFIPVDWNRFCGPLI
jgi:hypothetical protein